MASNNINPDGERLEYDYPTEKIYRLYCIFKKFLDVTSDGFIAVDATGKIIEINKSYCELLGIEYQDALNRNVVDLIPNTRLLHVLNENLTEVDVVDRHDDGILKGKILICSRSMITLNGDEKISFAHVRYPEKTTEVARNFQKVLHEFEYYKEEYFRYVKDNFSFKNVIGNAPEFIELKHRALKAAAHDFTVLLRGETGTGKEVFAHAIHHASPRAKKPFIRVNCSAIPHDLLESELFGYDEGAFSGARRGGKPGKMELADGGTLFLDEIGDMPLAMQAKMLRALQEKEVERLGATKPKRIDLRVIAATNCNLETLIAEKQFRADLFFRLNVINITLPPLRDRVEDIPLLAKYFLDALNQRYSTLKVFSDDAIVLLKKYAWPGNTRELLNAIERAFSSSDDDILDVKDFPSEILIHGKMQSHILPTDNTKLESIMSRLENKVIDIVLQKHNGNINSAAKELGIHRATLYKKIKKHS